MMIKENLQKSLILQNNINSNINKGESKEKRSYSPPKMSPNGRNIVEKRDVSSLKLFPLKMSKSK